MIDSFLVHFKVYSLGRSELIKNEITVMIFDFLLKLNFDCFGFFGFVIYFPTQGFLGACIFRTSKLSVKGSYFTPNMGNKLEWFSILLNFGQSSTTIHPQSIYCFGRDINHRYTKSTLPFAGLHHMKIPHD